MTVSARPALQVSGLGKIYGARRALDGLSLEVRAGEVLGLLGPNGAGKTTTIESIAGLIQPDEGIIRLCGEPLDRQTRGRIGLALQDTALQERITPREAITLFAHLYGVRPDREALLRRFGLFEQANRYYGQLSGGQKQRLALALAFVNDPVLILLDEPTAGLDPVARHDLHDLIRQLAAEGRAILLATHDMAEADRLCDRLVIIDRGRVVAEGRPGDLVGSADGATTIEGSADIALDPGRMPSLSGLALSGKDFRCRTSEPNLAMVQIVSALDAQGGQIVSLRVGQALLEDVILSLTSGAPRP